MLKDKQKPGAVIREDLQPDADPRNEGHAQPTEGKHPSSVKGIGVEGWMKPDDIKRMMGYNVAYSFPEGTVLAYRKRHNPNHRWQYGIYVENEDKARDQFHLGDCMLLHWPDPPSPDKA